MTDSWEDDDFQVPSITNNSNVKDMPNTWEEEEDTLDVESKTSILPPTPAQIEANKKKVEQEEIALANHLKYTAEEKESREEKKARERKQVEDSDTALAGELFGKLSMEEASTTAASPSIKTVATGLGGVPMKTKQDHTNFAIIASKKLSDSTPQNIGIFYKSLTEKLKDNLSSESINDVITILTQIRDDRKKTEAAISKSKVVKKTKKEIAAETKRHNDIFGGIDDSSDKYDQYYGIEDDFM
jgi:hypothetical protein